MAKTNAMMCPQCGQRDEAIHAEKIDYMAALTDPDATDLDLGGVVGGSSIPVLGAAMWGRAEPYHKESDYSCGRKATPGIART